MAVKADSPPVDRTPAEIAATVAKLQAEAAQAKAEADKFTAEAEKARLEVQGAEIVLAKARRAEASELAQDKYYKLYVFDTAVSSSAVEKCIHQLTEWSRTDPGCDIELLFNSPGGSIVDGMALYDFLSSLRTRGHKLTTSTLGMAASMAGILLQAGDVRRMGPESWLLIHEASFGALGSFGDVLDTVKWVEKVQDRILEIFANRSKLSKNTIKRKWHRTDWWISSDEALKCGFVDEIA